MLSAGSDMGEINNNNNNNRHLLRLCSMLLNFQSTGFERSIYWDLLQGILK